MKSKMVQRCSALTVDDEFFIAATNPGAAVNHTFVSRGCPDAVWPAPETAPEFPSVRPAAKTRKRACVAFFNP